MLDLELPPTEHCITFLAPQECIPIILRWLDGECSGRSNFNPVESLYLFSDWDMNIDVWFEDATDALLFDLKFRGSTASQMIDD